MQNKSIKPEPEYFKCPECGHRTELEYSGAISITKCERCRLFGNRNLWDKWADSERICLEWRKAYDCLEAELELTRKALDKGMEHITGLNNMIESWYKLLQGDKDASTKYAILKSAISAYVETKGGDNE